MSSSEDGEDLIAAFKKGEKVKSIAPSSKSGSDDDLIATFKKGGAMKSITTSPQPTTRKALCVRVLPVRNKEEYIFYEPKDEVVEIVREFSRRGIFNYEVKLLGNKTREVSAILAAVIPRGKVKAVASIE